jgi:hypothetical protein
MRTIFTNHQNIKTKLRSASAFIIVLLFADLFLINKSFSQAASSTWALTTNANASNSGNVSGGAHSFVGVTGSYNATDGALASNWSTTISSSKYYQVTIAPTASTNLSVTSVSFYHISHNSSMTVRVMYSLNGFATAGTQIGTDITTNSDQTSAQFVSPALSIQVNSGQTLTLRIYGAASSNLRQLGVRSLVISGTTTLNCPTITASVTGQSNLTCNLSGNGSITINATGGTGPWSYSVDNGATYTASATNPYVFGGLIAGQYKIRVKDANGCESKPVQ